MVLQEDIRREIGMTTIQTSISDEEPPVRMPIRLATSGSHFTAPRLRKMASDLRECAEISKWPDFAEKLVHAAESLEVQAVELEAGYSMAPRAQVKSPIYY